MISQCKGKDLAKVPESKLLNSGWIASIKYDGNYVQVHKHQNDIKFYTSGNKEFYHELAAQELISSYPNINFILECEFIGESEGKLGDRTKAAKLTSYRTNFEKSRANIGLNTSLDCFKVFDTIIINTRFEDRLNWLVLNLKPSDFFNLVDFEITNDLESSILKAKEVARQGYEGLYLKHKNHRYIPGKRVNDAIKLKQRPTADLICIDVLEGTGKYTGMIGSLILIDSLGRRVNVGSGLDDLNRSRSKDYFKNKVIEIEYEQILDTYIQPTFVRVRNDKLIKDID